jgi:hypothetical protein
VGFAILVNLPLIDVVLGLDSLDPIANKLFSEKCSARVFGHFDSGVIF